MSIFNDPTSYELEEEFVQNLSGLEEIDSRIELFLAMSLEDMMKMPDMLAELTGYQDEIRSGLETMKSLVPLIKKTDDLNSMNASRAAIAYLDRSKEVNDRVDDCVQHLRRTGFRMFAPGMSHVVPSAKDNLDVEIEPRGLTDEQRLMWFGRQGIRFGWIEEDYPSMESYQTSSMLLNRRCFSGEYSFRDSGRLLTECCRWVHSGSNILNLGPGLAAALLLTEPPRQEVPLVLPHKSIMVRLPPNVIPLKREGKDLSWVRWVVLSHVTIEGRKLIAARLTCKEGTRDVTVFLHVNGSRAKVKEVVTVQAAELGDQCRLELTRKTAQLLLRLLENLLVWMDCSGTTPERVHHIPRKKRKSARNHGWPTVWLVGDKVKLSKELMSSAKDYALGKVSSKTGPDWELRMQHVVRGHWKLQCHGPGRTLRKRIWVEPYMRGPEGDVAWSHVYEAVQPA